MRNNFEITDATEPEWIHFGDGGSVPNNPKLPVYLVRKALPKDASAVEIREIFESNRWGGTWTSTVFTYHHYHHDAHEALGVASGWADILLGGSNGKTVRLEAGDLVVLPAGTGHCRQASSSNFIICGAYPPGQENYTIVEANDGARARHGAAITKVPSPSTDPVFGNDGPLVDVWKG